VSFWLGNELNYATKRREAEEVGAKEPRFFGDGRCATLGRSQDVCRRNPGHLSKANGAYLVVDYFLRGLRSIKKKKKTLVLWADVKVEVSEDDNHAVEENHGPVTPLREVRGAALHRNSSLV